MGWSYPLNQYTSCHIPRWRSATNFGFTWGSYRSVVCSDVWWRCVPGIIQDVELYSGAQVKTMTGIGINRFYWPLRDDVIWYPPMDIIGLIPEPVPVTKRHKEIKMAVWKELCKIWPWITRFLSHTHTLSFSLSLSFSLINCLSHTHYLTFMHTYCKLSLTHTLSGHPKCSRCFTGAQDALQFMLQCLDMTKVKFFLKYSEIQSSVHLTN